MTALSNASFKIEALKGSHSFSRRGQPSATKQSQCSELLENIDRSDYKPGMNIVDLALVRKEVERLLQERQGCQPSEIADVIAGYVSRLLNSSAMNGVPVSVQVSDDITLELPPKPRTQFKDRARNDEGRRLTIEEFIQQEWGDYWHYGLLYSEQLRMVDPSLYKAFLYRTSSGTIGFADFLLRRGVLAKCHLINPPNGYEMQVRAIKASQAQMRLAKSGGSGASVDLGRV